MGAQRRYGLSLLGLHHLLGHRYAWALVLEGVLLCDAVDGLRIEIIAPILYRKLAVRHCLLVDGSHPLVHERLLAPRRQLVRLPIQYVYVLARILLRQSWNLVPWHRVNQARGADARGNRELHVCRVHYLDVVGNYCWTLLIEVE